MLTKLKEIIEMSKADARKFMADKHGQMNIEGLAMTIFTLVIIGFVSIYVANEIHGIANIGAGSVFSTASDAVIKVLNTSWGMMLIVVIAILAGVIIVAIRGGLTGRE